MSEHVQCSDPALGAGRRAAPLRTLAKTVFAAVMFAGAVWILAREFQGGNLRDLAAAISATPPWTIAAAIGATIISYAGLAASEYWALRVIGERLSAWRIALVTVAAYATSNALGFSLVTGNAVRLRLYTAWGLRSAQVVGIALLAGIAVILSGLITAGLALLATPRLADWMYLLGVALLMPAALWFLKVPRSTPLVKHWLVSTPSRRLGALTLAGAIVDWIFSGLALFVLLPDPTIAQFAPFLVVFILGSLVSAASGVPAGIGVFEAVVVILVQGFNVSMETAAALLLYRVIYALGPFFMVVLTFVLHDALSDLAKRRRSTCARGA